MSKIRLTRGHCGKIRRLTLKGVWAKCHLDWPLEDSQLLHHHLVHQRVTMEQSLQ